MRFDVTSVDVNHGFGVYDPNGRLIGSVQAMPGYTNELELDLPPARRVPDPLLRVLRPQPSQHGRRLPGRRPLMEAHAVSVLHPAGTELSRRPVSASVVSPGSSSAPASPLFGVMGLAGLAMRLSQAEVFTLSPSWFYRVMTLHGAGMLTGALLAMMGALWFVLRRTVPLDLGRMLFSYASILVGAVLVVVAVLLGGFAAGWTFLWPLPFDTAGAWRPWATDTFLVGTAARRRRLLRLLHRPAPADVRHYGGLQRALGIRSCGTGTTRLRPLRRSPRWWWRSRACSRARSARRSCSR